MIHTRSDSRFSKRTRVIAAVVTLSLLPMHALADSKAAPVDTAASRHYALPADAGVVNVKDPKFGAKGDGQTDDTVAIQKAISSIFETGSRYAFPPFIYFPEGTYLVSGPLESKAEQVGWSGGWRAGMLLVGESREKSVIKLKDNADGYTDAKQPRPVIISGSESDKRTKAGDKPLDGGGNRAFRHSVLNLTVDIGRGNAGAVGIDYVANNRGTIESVTIRSSDPQHVGHTGLKMTRNWPGPCLIKDVSIDGFERGIETAHFEYGVTFEDITLREQRYAGLVNKQNMLAIHNLISQNSVPAIRAEDENGLVVLVGGNLKGNDAKTPAIVTKGELYLRDITSTGYTSVVDASARKGATDLPADKNGDTKVDFYTTQSFALTGGDKAEPLRLPVRPTPLFWTTDFDQWVSPQKFLPEGQTKPADGDWTDAVQQALNADKPVVYLPNGGYRVSKTLVVPSGVRLVTGFQSALGFKKEDKPSDQPLLRFEGKDGESTTLEHLSLTGDIEHATARSVALRHCDIDGAYRNTAAGTGDMYIEDTIGPKPVIVGHGQAFFARQINIEFGEKPLIENNGGDLWLLGFKTEGEMTCIKQTAGRTELLGGLFYPLRPVKRDLAAIEVTGGSAALSYAMSGPKYPTHVRATVGKEVVEVVNKQAGRAAGLVTVVVPEKK